MNVLDLFSGIGGFALGLESVGMRTIAFCERDPFAASVLRHHWPDTPIYDDVRSLSAARLAADGVVRPDIIVGGFPCQPFSVAGQRKGTEDERHLWPHFARLVGELRPDWVIAENVPGIRTIAADGVCADLAALGYSVWPIVVGAVHAGAPHRRQRVWFVAHAARPLPHGQRDQARRGAEPSDGRRALADAERFGQQATRHSGIDAAAAGNRQADFAGSGGQMGDADRAGLAQRQGQPGDDGAQRQAAFRADWWLAEPDVGRVAHGVPARVDRLRCLGNAVVPQIVAAIGQAIMTVEAAQ